MPLRHVSPLLPPPVGTSLPLPFSPLRIFEEALESVCFVISTVRHLLISQSEFTDRVLCFLWFSRAFCFVSPTDVVDQPTTLWVVLRPCYTGLGKSSLLACLCRKTLLTMSSHKWTVSLAVSPFFWMAFLGARFFSFMDITPPLTILSGTSTPYNTCLFNFLPGCGQVLLAAFLICAPLVLSSDCYILYTLCPPPPRYIDALHMLVSTSLNGASVPPFV